MKKDTDGFICHVKEYRTKKKITQDELACAVNVRRETIVRLEAAQYCPSLRLALSISRVIDEPIENLFDFPDITPN